MSFHVLIAGGGIGGLCLARGLQQAGISCALYEATPDIGRAGYRLHMNRTGGDALRRCLPDELYELYVQTSRRAPRRECFTMIDHLGTEVASHPHIGPPNDPDRPHTAVNRRTLRQIMVDGLAGTAHFGRRVTGYEEDAEQVRLHLDDGSTATGDVLVAADGIHSVIRRQRLPHVQTLDSGMRGAYSVAPIDPDLLAELPPALDDGFVAATGPGGIMFSFGLFDPRRPVEDAVAELAPHAAIDPVDPYMMVNFGPVPGSEYAAAMPDLFELGPDELHALMRSAVEGWHPGLQHLVDRVDTASVFPISVRYLEPADPWSPSRVTFVGDAIHAMPPTYGAGANSALRDAAALLAALEPVARSGRDLVAAIGDYEADMREEVYPILRASSDIRSHDHDHDHDHDAVAGDLSAVNH